MKTFVSWFVPADRAPRLSVHGDAQVIFGLTSGAILTTLALR